MEALEQHVFDELEKVLEAYQPNQAESGAITQTQTLTGEDCSM
jgi:hypothetical protein